MKRHIMENQININQNFTPYEYIEDLNVSVDDFLLDVPNWEYRLALPAIYILFMLTGTLGNGLVVLVFIRNKTFRTITNMFLLNLAVTDLIYLLFCVPFTATNYYIQYWIFGNTLCKFVQYMMTVCLSLHVLTLTAVGIDRYLAIVHPVIALSVRTKRRCILVIGFIWLVSLLAFIPVIIINREIEAVEPVAYCLEQLSERDSKIYATAMLVFFYIVPQCILGFCYFQIVRQMRATLAKTRITQLTIVMKRRGRLVRLVAMVSLAFAISWLPLHLAAVISVSVKDSDSAFTYHLQNIAPCFSYANSVVNPFIYSFVSKTFRKFFKATFRCRSIDITTSLLADDAVVSAHGRKQTRFLRSKSTQTPIAPKRSTREMKAVKVTQKGNVSESTKEETLSFPLVESSM